MDTRSLALVSAILIVGILLFTPGRTPAADDAEVTGSVDLGVRWVNEVGESAKFQEYRDLSDGTYGSVLLEGYKDAYHLELFGRNIGLDDQDYTIQGGQYGKFKYLFNYDETPHNYSFDAQTFFSGVGNDNLTFSGTTPPPVADWSSFDYYLERKKYGGEIEVSMGTPFYVRIGASRLDQDGRKPFSSGGFSGTAEMPEPVDYRTDDLNLTAGYRSRALNVAVSGMLSTFENDNLHVSWKNPFNAASELNTLPPENEYKELKGELTWKQLPLTSVFSIEGSYSKITSDFSIGDLTLTAPAGLNSSNFDGEVSYSGFSTALASRPTHNLDTKLYYTYLDKDNDSDVIAYDSGGGVIESNASDLFSYTKNKAGIDLGYRLPFRTKADIGYEYLNMERTNRPDAETTTDNLGFIQVKNSFLDFLTAKVRYEHLNRNNETDFDFAGVTNVDAEYIERFIQRFDVTDKDKDEIKVCLEVYPVDFLDFGLEYSYAKNDYDDVTLGRTEDTRHKFYVDFLWHQLRNFTVSGFGGYEKCKAESDHYNFTAGSGTPPQTADPTIDDGNPSSYHWDQDIDDNFWTYGLSGQLRLMEDVLRLVVSWEYQKSNGESTFSTQGTTALSDIEDFDDYRKKRLEAKAIYAFTRQLEFTLGYVYEKYTYDDRQYEGYIYDPAGSYLTGAYTDHDYEASICYLMARYDF
jgi:MtrB/PioB family decaheme-associated outer membrane protein